MDYQNITSNNQSEEQVRNALQKLTFHLENTPLAVIEWDGEFRVKRWYKGAEKLFGGRADEAIGLHPDERSFVFGEGGPAVSGVIARCFTAGKKNPKSTHPKSKIANGCQARYQLDRQT